MTSTTSKSYTHITKIERLEIEILLGKGYSQRDIAQALGRDHTSIGREIKARQRSHTSRHGPPGVYRALVADHKAYVTRKYAKYQGKKIHEDHVLERYITEGLKAHWNPDEISGNMKREGRPFYASKTAIYAWLYSVWGQDYCQHLYHQRYQAKRRRASMKRVMIPDRVSITKRPLGATNRSRYGHFEGDTVVSGRKTGSLAALAVLYERKSRYLAARRLSNLKPSSFNQAVTHMQATVRVVRSLSLDNGIENRHHTKLSCKTFFCAPYASWQKGGVEHANKMIRRYLPKGSDLSLVSETELQRIVSIINNKPRKILGYKSALQVMTERRLLVQT